MGADGVSGTDTDDLVDLAPHDVPGYSAMVDRTLKWMGGTRRDFVGFRLRVKYPLLSTMIALRYRLPIKPPAPEDRHA